VWKTFLRGHHPLYMDPLDGDPVREAARRALGETLRVSRRIDLAACRPDPSTYALVNRTPDREEILTWLPEGRGRVDLSWARGPLAAEWLEPGTGKTAEGGTIEGGRTQKLAAPWKGNAVLLAVRHR
jgi:hypothetical protein